jgi:hypothetical protein
LGQLGAVHGGKLSPRRKAAEGLFRARGASDPAQRQEKCELGQEELKAARHSPRKEAEASLFRDTGEVVKEDTALPPLTQLEPACFLGEGQRQGQGQHRDRAQRKLQRV